MTEWRNDGMAEWRNDGMTNGRTKGKTIETYVFFLEGLNINNVQNASLFECPTMFTANR